MSGHEDCARTMRRLSIERDEPIDTEVREVGPLGVVQRHPDFPPTLATCPHGTTYQAQPTEWQIRDWELRRVP